MSSDFGKADIFVRSLAETIRAWGSEQRRSARALPTGPRTDSSSENSHQRTEEARKTSWGAQRTLISKLDPCSMQFSSSYQISPPPKSS